MPDQIEALVAEAQEAMALWDGDNGLSDAYLGMTMRKHLGETVAALSAARTVIEEAKARVAGPAGEVGIGPDLRRILSKYPSGEEEES